MLNSFIRRVAFSSAMMLLPIHDAMSKDISFDYVQIDFTVTTVDLGDSLDEIEGNGFGFGLSLDMNQHSAFTLSVISTTYQSFQDINVDTSKMTNIGATAHTLIAPATEVLTNLSVVIAEITANDGINDISDEDYGSVFSVGLRHLLTDRIEFELGGANLHVFGVETFSYNIDARYFFRNQFSFGMGYVSSENADSFQLNIRMDI